MQETPYESLFILPIQIAATWSTSLPFFLIGNIGGFPLATCSALPLKMFTALLRHSEEQNQSKTAALDALRTNTAEDCTRNSVLVNHRKTVSETWPLH